MLDKDPQREPSRAASWTDLDLPRLRLLGVGGVFAVCKLGADSPIPSWATLGNFHAITRTGDELSLVCRQQDVPDGVVREAGWRCLRVAGNMPFTSVGVLAALTVPMARARIGVFAFSTYDTDYLLVKADDFPIALAALQTAGHTVELSAA